jgi:hypothetical protein
MITLVRKGDAKGLFTALWNRFYKVTPLTVGAEVGAFWNLSQKNMAVDQFAAAVNDYSVRLAAADKPVTDQDMATVFVGGLTDKYLQLKERYRDKKVFQFAVVVEDAIDFASLHGLLKNASSSTAGTLLAVETVCKFHRMKKGCYAGDKCPLAKTHTKETKGKGWKEGDVKAVRPKGYKALCAAMKTQKDSSKDGKNSKPSKELKCFLCGEIGHAVNRCKLKEQFAAFKASQTGTINANVSGFGVSSVADVNCNFMIVSRVMAVQSSVKDKWLMDGGSDEHVTFNEQWLTNKEKLPEPFVMMVGNGQSLVATVKGTVKFNDVSVSGVLLCKDCPLNILSEGKFLEQGCVIKKNNTMAVIVKDQRAMIVAKPSGRLMFVSQAYAKAQNRCADL